jgi:hypothetical protein
MKITRFTGVFGSEFSISALLAEHRLYLGGEAGSYRFGPLLSASARFGQDHVQAGTTARFTLKISKKLN